MQSWFAVDGLYTTLPAVNLYHWVRPDIVIPVLNNQHPGNPPSAYCTLIDTTPLDILLFISALNHEIQQYRTLYIHNDNDGRA